MSNDLRDSWSNIHSYDHEMKVTLDYEDIVHELEHLPGIELLGNHTLSMRGIEGTSSSPLISIDIMLTDKSSVDESESSSSDLILYGSVIAAILLTIILVASILKSDQEKEINYDDSDIDEVVEAEIID